MKNMMIEVVLSQALYQINPTQKSSKTAINSAFRHKSGWGENHEAKP